MRWVVLVVLMFISLSGWCHPRDSARVAERQKAKIERQKKRIMNKWDERSMQQRRTDRRVIIFLALSAGILVNSLAHKE